MRGPAEGVGMADPLSGEGQVMNTRTIAILALIIAVILLLILVV